MVGVGGFPRTALSRRLWGIPDDLTARCLSNLLIVEPLVLISPLHHKTKTDQMVGLCFGGSGWIRTTSGLSQQIYSLPRLSNSGARPISFNFLVRAAGNRAYKNTTSCVISNELMFASQGYPTQLHLTYSLGAGSGTRTRISSLEGLHTSPCTMPATNSKPCDYILILPKRKYFSQGRFNYITAFRG